ncbi:MAG: hypothetical protein B6245_20310 [Desulfobacteraceae bacterium 4572_88]|nr:MAG: hypothetical protein B6245_20310 [Desulfobacteraceae bacterium 4572_88]
MRKVVVKTRNELDRWFKDRLREAFLFSKNRIFIKALLGQDRETAQNMLEEYRKASSPVYENLLLADPEGVVALIAVGQTAGLDMKSIPLFVPMIKKIGGPAQVVVNSIYFLIFIHIRNSVALNGKIMLFL